MARATLPESARHYMFRLLDAMRCGSLSKQVDEIESVLAARRTIDQFQQLTFRRLSSAASTTRHYAPYGVESRLSDYPILEKRKLKEGPDSVRAMRSPSAKLIEVSTSGSHGIPLTLNLTREKKLRQRAEIAYFGQWADYRIGTKYLYIRGRPSRGRLSRLAQNQIFAASTTLTESWMDEQIRVLQGSPVRIIIGIPSAIALLARRALERGIEPTAFSVRGVIASGETLTDSDRTIITHAFGTSLCLSRYSTEELGVLAAECPEHKVHHVNEATFIVEILKLDDDQPAATGDLGRIVVTDLFSHAMPLIRYDTGDLGIRGGPCKCGRPTQTLMRVEGRVVEMLTTPEGATLTPFFINPIMRRASTVRQFQFAQTSSADYELRYIGGDSPAELKAALVEICSVLGENATVHLRNVTSIQPLPSGKRPYVVDEWIGRV